MHDPNRLMKWILVIGLVVVAIITLYPPSEKLKGGIDLVGGTSLLYEIDTKGLDAKQQAKLSQRVMLILKDRVDPHGQMNLEWRPVGNTRLEIRMPRPPKEALARRETYNESIDQILLLNIGRRDVEEALNASADQRDRMLADLQHGVIERDALLSKVKETFDAYVGVRDGGDTVAEEEASNAYEDAISALLESSMPVARFTDVLALENEEKRSQQLKKIRDEYPSYDLGDDASPTGKLLTKAVTAYDAWAVNKADLEDPSDLKRRLRGAGVLEFRILADRDSSSPTFTQHSNPQLRQSIDELKKKLARYGPRPQAGDRYSWFLISDPLTYLRVDDLEEIESKKNLPGYPIIEEYAGRWYVMMHNDPAFSMLHSSSRDKKWKLVTAYPDRNMMTGENVVSFQLDARGGRLFGELTGTNIKRQLGIMLDGEAMSYATINDRITNRCQISGSFTADRVQDLVTTLEAGSLPARLKETPLSEKTIGPSLGKSNREKGFKAAAWGAILVAGFVLVYYGVIGGGVANIALAMNLLFVLSMMALMQATFTLPGIAALILTVGMAIDANVLIFERIREERIRGIVFKRALNMGYEKAFSTIVDANLTTLLICIILGFVGSEEVKGFAIVLGIGITTSMFTALFVTRLIFNSLISWGMLKDLRMMRIIGVPSIDWLGLRRIFWPISIVAVVLGISMFVGQSVTNKEAVYDIEFLGGTSVQIDLKPGVAMTDDEVREAIIAVNGDANHSAVQWLNIASEKLAAAQVRDGDTPGTFVVRESELSGDQNGTLKLSGDQIGILMFETIEDKIERDGIYIEGESAYFVANSGSMTLESFKAEVAIAAQRVKQASNRLKGARVQTVGEVNDDDQTGGVSYEIVTTETNRALVQAAIVAVLGNRLLIQQAIHFSTLRDDDLTKDNFFVVETDDHYLSDVIGGEATFDVRHYRGGAAIVVNLNDSEEPLPVSEIEKRLREIGLQSEFQHIRTRDSAVFPLGAATSLEEGENGYKSFAIVAVDDTLLYDDDPVRWADSMAMTELDLIRAGLGREKSLSKVVQFAAPIAGQTRNRAVYSIVLALFGIVSYLWLRFGSKEYGLAAIVALVHDVMITLGLVAGSYFISDTFLGTALMIDAFKVDLPMIAAILTVIGYSLNDTIVVFDRIRENRGRISTLAPSVINNSINQTLSRTLLTSITTFMVVAVLFVFGGKGVHGFSFALLIGVVVGTYSSIGIATPLLYHTAMLRAIIAIIAALILMGMIFATINHETVQLVLSGIVAVICLIYILKNKGAGKKVRTSHPVTS